MSESDPRKRMEEARALVKSHMNRDKSKPFHYNGQMCPNLAQIPNNAEEYKSLITALQDALDDKHTRHTKATTMIRNMQIAASKARPVLQQLLIGILRLKDQLSDAVESEKITNKAHQETLDRLVQLKNSSAEANKQNQQLKDVIIGQATEKYTKD